MAQRIDFAPVPNTAPMAWHATLVPFLAEVHRAGPGAKAVREWMRLRNLFDKDGFATLLDLLDIRLGEPTTLGPVAKALLDAADEGAAREVLGRRLVGSNPLLAKYVLEALDADKGGRLHSTNELYRLITSYVYPGTKPTLTAFKAWVDWAVAAGLVKLVGIRWALGDAGREALPRMRALDAEEFLEDERAAAAGGEAPDADDLPDAPEAPVPPPAEEPGAPVDGDRPAPPAREAPAPDAEEPPAPPAPAARRGHAAPPPPAAPAARPMPPLRIPSPEAFVPAPAAGPLDLASTRDALVAWHARYPGRRPPLAVPVGATDAFEAAAAALWIARGMAPADAGRALATLRDNGLLLEAGRGTLTLAALASAAAGSPDPAVAAALESAPALPRLHAGTRDASLLQAADPRDLLDRLWRRLYAPAAPLAPFLLARLLAEGGLLPDALHPAGTVPTFTVRENAFRIGFLPRLHAGSFPELVESALALAAWFPPPDGEAPLAVVHEGFGCAFRCGRAPACPLSCLERVEVAPGRSA